MNRTLTFARLRAANLARLPCFTDRQGRLAHPPVEGEPPGFDWSIADWVQAVTGELGEFANLAKKVRRGDLTLDAARPDLAKELADVVIYLDILAHRCGVDLGEATVAKWDEVSERIGVELRIDDPENDR